MIQISTRADSNAARYLDRLQVESRQANSGAHFLDRHGFHTTLEQQYVRASTGLTPDGVQQSVFRDSSRFFTARDQVAAIQRAQLIYAREQVSPVRVEMRDILGNGFTKSMSNGVGLDYIETAKVITVLKNGRIYTQYAVLR